jgi:hypothetical protein
MIKTEHLDKAFPDTRHKQISTNKRNKPVDARMFSYKLTYCISKVLVIFEDSAMWAKS